MNKYLVVFYDGPKNGMRRFYDTLTRAKLAAKAYVRQNNRNWSDCNAYADIYELDSFYNEHRIMTIE